MDNMIARFYHRFIKHMKKQSGQRNGSSSPFLDKFLGRSTKIGLQGISGVIAEARTLVMRESDLRNRIPSGMSSIIQSPDPRPTRDL